MGRVSSQRASSARARLAAAVTQEILGNVEEEAFPISSEHQLCRQYNLSRVTVRLALGDLENRGLIYRRHGLGTFAHGRSTRIHRYLGVLIKTGIAAEHRPIVEMLRGAQEVMAGLRSGTVLISNSPAIWRAEEASSLGGVIVVPQDVTEKDLEVLKDRNLPYLIFGESHLPGPRLMLGQRAAACRMTERLLDHGHRHIALLTGFDPCLDAPKRMGVHDALRAAGLDPAQAPEFSACGQEGAIFQAARELLQLQPRPTAVVAFDDSLGSILSFQARRNQGIQVPGELSIASFHDWPYLNFIEPALTTARFEFFAAGQRAAQALSHAALIGEPVCDINFEPIFRPGQTVGPVPAEA
jgi:DNA-binding LacI/PurR family transcriptional regulator